MVDSAIPGVFPALASPKKTFENSSHFGGDGPCLPVDHDTLSNLTDLSILWY